MVNLCDMMSEGYDDNTGQLHKDAENYEHAIAREDTSLSTEGALEDFAQQLGTSLGMASMMLENDREELSTANPEEVIETFDSIEKRISIKNKTENIPAFERMVYKKCGIL